MSSPREEGGAFWRGRWAAGQIGFHESQPNVNLVRHAERFLEGRARVLVPLAGKSLDLRWLAERGLDVIGVELVDEAVHAFFAEAGVAPEASQRGPFRALSAPFGAGRVTMLVGDALELSREVTGDVDAIFDRAALIALDPGLRAPYVAATAGQLQRGARVLLVAMEHDAGAGPPFDVDEGTVRALYAPVGTVELLDRNDIAETAPHILAKGATHVREACYFVDIR